MGKEIYVNYDNGDYRWIVPPEIEEIGHIECEDCELKCDKVVGDYQCMIKRIHNAMESVIKN